MLSLLRALGFLSILPLGSLAQFEREDIPAMWAAFPLAGVVLALLLGNFWEFAVAYLPLMFAAIVTVAAWAVLTRGLHLDGLADCADGIGGAHAIPDRLRIMKDPQLGTFGMVALSLALLAKFAAIHHLTVNSSLAAPVAGWMDVPPTVYRVWILALIMSGARWAVSAATLSARYARPDGGLGQDFILGIKPWSVIIGAIVPFLLAVLSGGPGAFMILASMLVGAVLLRTFFHRALGGLTGDTLGASIELSEILALMLTCSHWSPVTADWGKWGG